MDGQMGSRDRLTDCGDGGSVQCIEEQRLEVQVSNKHRNGAFSKYKVYVHTAIVT